MQSNLAAACLDAGEFEQVLAVGLPAFEFFQQHGYSHRLAGTACSLAEASDELGDYAQAERYANLAVASEAPTAIPYALYTLALVRHANQDADAALKLLVQCRDVAAANEDIFIEAYAWLKTAEMLAQDDVADDARDDLADAIEQAQRLFRRMGMEGMAQQAAQLQ